MIQQVAFAASSDDARPILTGVLITVNGEKLILAAADGFRLSVRNAIISSPVPRANQRSHTSPRPDRTGPHRQRQRTGDHDDSCPRAGARSFSA